MFCLKHPKYIMSNFIGLTDSQWNLIEYCFPSRGVTRRGNQPADFRKVLNSILWILFTGARWKDLPRGDVFAPRSTAHEWLGIWQKNSTLETVLKVLQEIGVITKAIDLSRTAGGERID